MIDTALSVLWVVWAACTANPYCKGTTPWAGERQGGYPGLPLAQEDQGEHATPLLIPPQPGTSAHMVDVQEALHC